MRTQAVICGDALSNDAIVISHQGYLILGSLEGVAPGDLVLAGGRA